MGLKVVIEREEGWHKKVKEDLAELEITWIGTKKIEKTILDGEMITSPVDPKEIEGTK